MVTIKRPQFYLAIKVPLDGGGSGLLGTGIDSGFLGTAIGTFSSVTVFLMTVGTLKILVHFKNLYRIERQVTKNHRFVSNCWYYRY